MQTVLAGILFFPFTLAIAVLSLWLFCFFILDILIYVLRKTVQMHAAACLVAKRDMFMVFAYVFSFPCKI